MSPVRRRTNCPGVLGRLVLVILGCLGVATASATSASGPAIAAAVPPSGAPLSASPFAPARTVTLITGDRVVVPSGGGQIRVAGIRDGQSFSFYREHGDTFVVPVAAVPMLASGRVDSRLFDVSLLIRDHDDDAHRASLPVIVRGGSFGALARVAGAVGVAALPAIDGEALRVRKADARGFWSTFRQSATSTTMWLDGTVRASVDRNVRQIGAPQAWHDGYVAAGVRVGVLDSGIDLTHPDLADAVVASRDFTDSPDGVQDDFGHGTHVAATITGSGAASNGAHVGVAPGAQLVVGKVLDAQGYGNESDVIAAMQWITTRHVQVVNMSLGADDRSPVLDDALNSLTRTTGTLFVVAAGNSGADVGSPAAAAAALTVGAVDGNNRVAAFSARGTVDGGLKPELTAPGVGIVAARAAGSTIGYVLPGGQYQELSGTSMAAPHVTGAAAILAGEHPSWTAAELKNVLIGTAEPGSYNSITAQGAGRVDVARAVHTQISAAPGTVDAGTASWPHLDDPVTTRTITYDNSGSAAVTLRAGVAMSDPAGQRPPAGTVTVTPARITIPAGHEARVTLTINTRFSGQDGRYTGLLRATGAGQTVATPITFTKEVESYDVPVTAIYPDGTNPLGEVTVLYNPALDRYYGPSFLYSTTVRLPRGSYEMVAYLAFATRGDHPRYPNTTEYEPALKVTSSRPIVTDARQGRPLGVTLDISRPRLTDWTYFGTFRDGFGGGNYASGEGTSFVVPSHTHAPAADFAFYVQQHFDVPGDGNRAVYYPGYLMRGYLHSRGLIQHQRVADLGWERSVDADRPSGTIADRTDDNDAPSVRTVYATPGIPWADEVDYVSPDGVRYFGGQSSYAHALTHRGYNGTEKWGYGVLGPGLAGGRDGFRMGRYGDDIAGAMFLYCDGDTDHYGSLAGRSSTTLYRNGRRLATAPGTEFDLPVSHAPATYRVVMAASQHVLPTSTRTSVAWTFRSRTGPFTSTGTGVPIMTVRVAPTLDRSGTTPSGRPLTIPMHVERQLSAGYGRLRSVNLDISYDDGTTWQPAPVTRHGLDATAEVDSPRGSGFASLRVTAADAAGNTVRQTIIRAYALRG